MSDEQLELAYAGTEMKKVCDIGVVNGTSMDYYFIIKIYRSPGLKQQFNMNGCLIDKKSTSVFTYTLNSAKVGQQ